MDGDTGDPIEALPLEDKVSLYIGRVCRADVELEVALIKLYVALHKPRPLDFVTPDRVELVWKPLRSGLDAMPILAAWRDAGLSVLDDAMYVHNERNRVVHDTWMIDYLGIAPDDHLLHFKRGSKVPYPKLRTRTLADLRRVLAAIGQINGRLRELSYSLYRLSGDADPRLGPPSSQSLEFVAQPLKRGRSLRT